MRLRLILEIGATLLASGPGDPSTVCDLETSPSGGAFDRVVEGKTARGQLLCRRQILGESPRLAYRGAVIKFKIDGGHVRFEITLAAADEPALTIRSELLRLARVIRK